MACSCCFALFGCDFEEEDADSEDSDVELGAASDAFSGYAGTSVIAVGGYNPSNVTVSPSGNQAFLNSVAGNFSSLGGLSNPYLRASVSGSTFTLAGYPSGSNTVAGQGYAVYTGTSTLAAGSCDSYANGSPHQVNLTKPAGNGNYACFLTEV